MSSLWDTWRHTPAVDREAFVRELCLRYSPLVCEALKKQNLCHGRVITDCEIDLIVTQLDAAAEFVEFNNLHITATDLRHVINQLKGGN